MLRTLFWVTWLFAYFAYKLPTYWKAKRLGKQGRIEEQQELVEHTVQHWARLLLKNLKVPVVLEGAENLPPKDKTVVYVSNHQSYVDIPVLLGYLAAPCPLMGKRELGKVPFLGKWMHLLGCIFVAREDARASVVAMRQAEAVLEGGRSLIVCPEGTRSRSDDMGEFKGGAVRIATKAGVPVVPIAIDGTWRVLEGSHWRLKRATVRMVVLPMVETATLSREEQKGLHKVLEDDIRRAKDAR